MATRTDSSSGRFLTFRVDSQLYALAAEDVAEVMLPPVLAHIPQAPPALHGVANLRGSVLPVAGLRELLGKAAQAATPQTRALVLDVGAAVALVVDSVETLESATPGQIEARRNELTAAEGERLVGAFSVGQDGAVAKILDIEALLAAAFTQRAGAPRRSLRGGAAQAAVQRDAESEGQTEVFVTVDVAGQEFGLSLDAVREIIPLPAAVTGVARADAAVLGVISVRDALLPLLSLRNLLGLGARPANAGNEKVVVTNVAGTQVGLVADRARAIVVAPSAHVDPVPSVLAARTGGEARIRAIYRGDAGRRLISILSPEQLFREDVMQKVLAGHSGRSDGGAAGAASADAELIFVVFRLGGDEFGLPVENVVEVAQVPEQITRVPKTPKFLEGVVNLRGDVLPVIDQRRRFDMPKLEAGAGRRLLVIQTERHRAGLIVDSVADVLRVAADAIEPPPALTEATQRLVRGVVNLEDAQRLVLVLDPAEVLTRAERGLLDTFQAGKKTDA